jgi:hypothetical protein
MYKFLDRILQKLRGDRSVPTPNIDVTYFRLATEYYVAARASWSAGGTTVAGNLVHHAIEMYLKGDLAREESPECVRGYGHDLKRLWKAYKKKHSGKSLSAFDRTIKDVHKFEDIRYPDAISKKGMFFSLPLSRPSPPLRQNFVRGGATPPTYFVALDEVDALVKAVYDTASVDPEFDFRLLTEEGRAALHRYNTSFPSP